MYTVTLRFEDEKTLPVQWTAVPAGQTLLELLLDNNVNVRHDCGGVCYCTTCSIHVEKGGEFIDPPTTREIDFLKKVPDRKPASRLACQCLLLEGRGAIDLLLPTTRRQPRS